MAKRSEKTGPLTLAVLLDQEQPYNEMGRLVDPDLNIPDDPIIRKIQGSLVGLAVGDALGASVEFRPNAYLKEHPVTDMQSGGTWGLQAGQWTDDTSMALCLAASLVIKGGFKPFDQFVRYSRWYKNGYMSSTGKCFDIGKSTRQAIEEFNNREQKGRMRLGMEKKYPAQSDYSIMLEYYTGNEGNDFKLGSSDAAGNGPLMRLAPIPCFFFESYDDVKKNMDEATQLTHGDQKAIDACQFYACLIWLALRGTSKKDLLDPDFYQQHLDRPLHKEVLEIAQGSYKIKDGYKGGIRGKGYIVNALEAALWAFHNDGDDFRKGVLLAINLGDDTDTTAAIYGELAGAVYGIENIPSDWVDQLYQKDFIKIVAKGLYVKGKQRSGWSDKDDQKNRQRGANNTRHDDDKVKEIQQTRFTHDGGANNTGQDGGKTNKTQNSRSTQHRDANDTSYKPKHTTTAHSPQHNQQGSTDGAAGSRKDSPHVLPE